MYSLYFLVKIFLLGSSLVKPDEVKMVLYIAEECGMPCFHWLFTEGQLKSCLISGFFFVFFCFGRGTNIARRDHGGGLALPESCRGYCQSRYDTEITRNRQ